jgi:hypothetical protein
MMKLLGLDLPQQGTFTRERGRLTNLSAKTWGFLSSLIHQCDPYAFDCALEVVTGENDTAVMYGSEFEDVDGRLYRVTGMDATHASATSFYPQCSSNELLSCEKAFDLPVVKELILNRLNGK